MAERDPGSALPLGIRRLWGLDLGTKPGQRPSLDVRQVARAAIELADEGGLEAVSMGRVAASLGVTPMALYRYVESKDELLELMLEVAVGDPPPLDPALEWRDALAAWARGLVGVYRRHPWSVTIPVTAPPRGPHRLAWVEQGMATLRDTALTAAERLDAVTLLLVYVRGAATLERQLPSPETTGGDRAEVASAADDVPTAGASGETGVAFGLARILDGLELLIRRRRRSGRRPVT